MAPLKVVPVDLACPQRLTWAAGEDARRTAGETPALQLFFRNREGVPFSKRFRFLTPVDGRGRPFPAGLWFLPQALKP